MHEVEDADGFQEEAPEIRREISGLVDKLEERGYDSYFIGAALVGAGAGLIAGETGAPSVIEILDQVREIAVSATKQAAN